MMCFDCPHLDHVSMINQRADWKPRDRCCSARTRRDILVIDDPHAIVAHLRAGQGIDILADDHPALRADIRMIENPRPIEKVRISNRSTRRANAAKARKGKP